MKIPYHAIPHHAALQGGGANGVSLTAPSLPSAVSEAAKSKQQYAPRYSTDIVLAQPIGVLAYPRIGVSALTVLRPLSLSSKVRPASV